MQFQRSFSYPTKMKLQVETFIQEFENDAPYIEVQTSGSTGIPKRMLVEKLCMRRSAQRTLSALDLHSGAVALICLPVKYIAGKMMVVRALVGSMRIEAVTPASNPLLEFDESKLGAQTLLAVTPHQLAEIINNPASLHVFQKISHVIIGGGAIPANVEAKAAALPQSMAVYATYGMTETLSHIALRRVNGPERQNFFSPLEGVQISRDADGCLVISDSFTTSEPLRTNDLVDILPNGGFRILGRRDNVISSGGVKLQLETLEQQLAAKIPADFMLTYINDDRLGQALTMLYVGDTTAEELRQLCADTVGRYEVPKHFFRVAALPTTETGKPARSSAHQLAEELAHFSN